MILIFDIGNTNITIGLFDDDKNQTNAKKVWRISSIRSQTADEYAIMLMDLFHYSGIKFSDIKYCAGASVVPHLNGAFEELAEKYLKQKIFFINSDNCAGLEFLVKNPKEVGADRIANAAAAFHLFGGESVVIDFGTATTFDCIDKDGKYLGGAIALGPSNAAKSLSLKTAQLPHVEIKKVSSAIGKSTVECIQSGLYIGYIGLIKEIILRIKNEMIVKHIVATGGLAYTIASEIKEIEKICPDLTLYGIKLIWEKSRK
ncbi:MAG: type III pantothenate kinase [Elusimicrobiota bacterium]|jgi:type III pantothenate kinase|nr:type III pantothenate kinase [Elusimicrobiota bacterium]